MGKVLGDRWVAGHSLQKYLQGFHLREKLIETSYNLIINLVIKIHELIISVCCVFSSENMFYSDINILCISGTGSFDIRIKAHSLTHVILPL